MERGHNQIVVGCSADQDAKLICICDLLARELISIFPP
jgi:hypothetical protein